MRIAFVCSDKAPCPPVRGGAIQLLVSEVAPILAEHHAVTVYSIEDTGLPRSESVGDLRYLRFPQRIFLKKVKESLKDEHFDIIQVYNRPNWILELHEVSPESKMVLSLHNLLYETVKVDKSQAQDIVKHADRILTVSSFVARDTMRKWPQATEKVTALYTGVNPRKYERVDTSRGKKWRREIRAKYGIGNKDPVVLFVGRLVPYKGCHVVIEAMQRLKRHYAKAKLLVVGSKWYADNSTTPYIESLHAASSKIPGMVIFAAYIPVEDIPKYYAAADVFVCASQWKEPLARVHYEAMAAGLPIVTTDRGGNAEVVQDQVNGYVVRKYKDPKEFERRFHRLLKDAKLRRTFGGNGYRMVREQYNFRQVAENLAVIYTDLLGNQK